MSRRFLSRANRSCSCAAAMAGAAMQLQDLPSRAPASTEPAGQAKMESGCGKPLRTRGSSGLNAGKSTFINARHQRESQGRRLSFTTTRPQLGVVRTATANSSSPTFGLIEGAAEGVGIGDRFLGHIERCKVLLHLVDAHGDDPAGAYRTVRDELENYGAGLTDKIEIVALNKADLLDAELTEALIAELAAESGAEVLPLSGATGQGLELAIDRLVSAIGTVESITRTGGEDEEEDGEWSPL